MPSATATLSLNVSAIQSLCKGTSILTGVGAPSNSIGITGDLYMDQTAQVPPLVYNLYGPKPLTTGVWPVTSFQLPSTALLSSISATFTADVSALSAGIDLLATTFLTSSSAIAASALTIRNFGDAIPLTIQQLSATSLDPIALFKSGTSTTLVVTNTGSVGINISTPDSDAALHVVGNTHITGDINTAGNLAVVGNATFTNTVCSLGNSSRFGNFFIYTNQGPSSERYNVIGTFIDTASSLSALSAYTAFFLPALSAAPGPFRIQNTYFSVGSAAATDLFFFVDPSARFTYCNGGLSSVSAFATNFYDSSSRRLLTNRQAGPGRLSLTTSTTADIITNYNALYSALTAHGLIT